MSTEVFERILAYQGGNAEAALELVEKFKPLLKKYAYMLNKEDAYEDLQCYFLSFLKEIRSNNLRTTEDGAIITYIVKAVKNKYIAMSKENASSNCVDYVDGMPPSVSAGFERKHNHNDLHDALLKRDLRTLLTDNEYRILVALYFEQWSVSEIAQQMHKSRQSVNQAKNHALNKLRRLWAP